MKKLLALTLVVVLMFSLFIPANAAEETAVEVNAGEKEIADMNTVYYREPEVSDDGTADKEEGVVYYGINELNPDDFVKATPHTVNQDRRAYLAYDFQGAIPGSVYSDFIEHVVYAGSDVELEVNLCVWSPEWFELEVGIYNWATGENWYQVRTGGQIVSNSLFFPNVSAGRYSAYIRNNGPNKLYTGYILYDLR